MNKKCFFSQERANISFFPENFVMDFPKQFVIFKDSDHCFFVLLEKKIKKRMTYKRYFNRISIYIFLLFGLIVQAFSQNYVAELSEFRENYIKDVHKKFANQKLDFFEINQNFKIEADYKLQKKNKVVSFLTSDGIYKKYQVFATISFEIEGKKYHLTTYKFYPAPAMYRKLVFLPLKDLTAPEQTYGAGRYLDLSSDDFKDGKTVLDFNKLYNPYCAYSDNYSCPIPPKENHLEVNIEAGEKLPLTKH